MTARTGDVSAAEFNASQAAINELMQLVAKQDAELTALKGRRCDGCKHWVAMPDDAQYGDCRLRESDVYFATGQPYYIDDPIDNSDFITAVDYHCAAWEAKQ